MNDQDRLNRERQVLARLRGRGGELQLQRRGSHYEIIYNGVFLMADYNGGSERAAVRRGLGGSLRLPGATETPGAIPTQDAPPAFRVLMGGLGWVSVCRKPCAACTPPP